MKKLTYLRYLRNSGLLLFLTIGVMGVLTLSSCRIPGMHTATVEQGNLITQEMVNQLKRGMTEEQVEFVLGSPVHRNSFNINQWVYIYVREHEGERERKKLMLEFEDGTLARISGDYVPSPDAVEAESNEASLVDPKPANDLTDSSE
ncbi:MAG: outer membrane protein assembly factor BamE [Gammaproteobacteria bacterium]|nr:outer membrane protein assembly factor BamE [Gammaproteobacteria bacterium]MXX95187.1 outer membrane protein assembly factor BamE [Gammaproteobacteria bacterium]MYF53448.1 outer membrane protein assembly factor BamE [Gammaproteobacteria bacterium]MYK42651.1 outer membrane protein assembly factor BamE [Gammaproteobacteria bacterium]